MDLSLSKKVSHFVVFGKTLARLTFFFL